MSDDDILVLEEVRVLAEQQGVPGPDVADHPVNADGSLYDGPCYCAECLHAH